jgi:hypothetical protein
MLDIRAGGVNDEAARRLMSLAGPSRQPETE